eukprot:3027748-Amphidinium_carterae.1
MPKEGSNRRRGPGETARAGPAGSVRANDTMHARTKDLMTSKYVTMRRMCMRTSHLSSLAAFQRRHLWWAMEEDAI